MRHIIYHKGLENEFDIVSPGVFGGLNSEQYLALNAQGKMPLLLLPTGQALPESEVSTAPAVTRLLTEIVAVKQRTSNNHTIASMRLHVARRSCASQPVPVV